MPATIVYHCYAKGPERYILQYEDSIQGRMAAYAALVRWERERELSFDCQDMMRLARIIAPQDAGPVAERRERTAPPAFIRRLVVVTWAAACGVVIYFAGKASGKL